MRKCKRAACALLATLLVAVTAAGCSTPRVAMTVGGREYETGEYLAYLYNTFISLYYSGLYQYHQYGLDIWAQEFPYGEGDDAPKLKLAEYIKATTKDTIVRMKAYEDKMNEYGLSISQEDLDEFATQMKSVKNDNIIQYGFNKEHYSSMVKATTYNQSTLFYGLYDKGGKREVGDEEVKKYFDENYLSYKMIEISLVDSDKKELSDAEKQKVMDRLERYLTYYNKEKDFDKAIDQYEKDETASKTTTTSGTTGTGTTTAGGATTTAAATTTTTTVIATTTTQPATTTTGSGPTATGGTTVANSTGESGSGDDEEEDPDPNRQIIDANLYGDEDFTNAVKTVKIGEAKIVTYKKSGTDTTAALILRMDATKDKQGKDTLTENRENILWGARKDEFNKEIDEYIKTLTVDVNDSAVKKCNPKNFLED